MTSKERMKYFKDKGQDNVLKATFILIGVLLTLSFMATAYLYLLENTM